MNLIVFVSSLLLLLLAQWRWSHLDRYFSGMAVLIVIAFAGLRNGGFDYDEYITMIEIIQKQGFSGGLSILLVAKDPFFGATVCLVNLFSERPELVIFLNVAVALMVKRYFLSKLGIPQTLFWVVYGIFLSTGLEFAAIRGAVAIGFLVAAIGAREYKVLYLLLLLLSVSAHISTLPCVVVLILWKQSPGRNELIVYGVITLASFIAGTYIGIINFERSMDYAENTGTIFALVPSLITFAMWFWVHQAIAMRECSSSDRRVLLLSRAAGVAAAIGLGLSGPKVTMSTRMNEIAWVLILVLMIIALECECNGTSLSYIRN